MSSYALDLAKLFPSQGQWSVEDYFSLTNQTRHLVELVEGRVEVLPMPTEAHQLIVQYLFLVFHAHIAPANLGTLLFAPIRVRTVDERYREPDLAFMLAEHAGRRSDDFWDGADLVVEVVSEDDASRTRDWRVKRAEYAQAGIEEYWIVDPQQRRIVVLNREGDHYRTSGEYRAGEQAPSELLPGLTIDVSQAMEAGKG